jgi:hypothetical protein
MRDNEMSAEPRAPLSFDVFQLDVSGWVVVCAAA